jgi:PAS domain S-box-containing protein
MSSVAHSLPKVQDKRVDKAGFRAFAAAAGSAKSRRKVPRPVKGRVRVAIEPDRMEKRAEAFLKLGRQLNAVRTPKEAASIILAVADELFSWDACIFDMLTGDRSKAKTVMCIDTVNGQRTEFPPESCSAQLSAAAREHLSRPELILRSPGSDFPPGINPFGNKRQPSASLMYVPLKHDEKVIGFLSFQSYKPNAYTEADLGALQALADHCGGALERMRAEEQVLRLNQELRHRLEELQALFEVAPVGISVAHDPQCSHITGNPAFVSLLGIDLQTNASMTGPNSAELPFRITRDGEPVPPEDLPMQRAAREAASIREELEIRRKDGRIVYTYISAAPLFDDQGKVRGSVGMLVDMTERKRAEAQAHELNQELDRRVRDRTGQLEAINKELEAFCYSVSHDLRAPLRSIRGFTEVLLERYAPQLDSRGQDFLRRTCASSHQMDRLIEDLLKLSRVGRSELHCRSVNLSELVSGITAELRKAEPERIVELKIAPDLGAHGDERLLALALDNLLSSAWKFTSRIPHATIEFGAVDQPEPAFFVRDNGAGFDMAYANRLFGVFQRLHAASDYPGTGIGLATVQRIINRHGGRAWAEGKPNEGATFYFTLPDHGGAQNS